jgi:glycosyltransferase involved in cell wall biosynthesis
MKVLLIIDHFGSGGAQRQIVELACGLKRRGHAVEMFVYFPQHNFFRARLEEHHIVVHDQPLGRESSFKVISRLASTMRKGAFDVAVSYLATANIYAELARIAAPGTRLVVSERTSFHDDKSALSALLRRLLYLLSDQVVANSESQAAWLQGKSWLRGRVSCIYNGVDLNAFKPHETRPKSARELRLIGIGRVGPEKNVLNLIAGLAEFGRASGWVPDVGWAGQRDSSPAGRRYCGQIDALLERSPLVKQHWQWLGLQTDVSSLMRDYHALVHPSLYEGLPNAICEALAAGMPVIASGVCDHPLLVADGARGFLFDPREPASIAAAIAKLTALDGANWQSLGRNAREYASAHLSLNRMVDSYEMLFENLLALFGSAQV